MNRSVRKLALLLVAVVVIMGLVSATYPTNLKPTALKFPSIESGQQLEAKMHLELAKAEASKRLYYSTSTTIKHKRRPWPTKAKPTAASTTPPAGGALDAKLFIYTHESGNNPASVNRAGCRGLGQACPGSKLPCGNDYACQDQWFTDYCMSRYGSWEAAKAFWLAHRYW